MNKSEKTNNEMFEVPEAEVIAIAEDVAAASLNAEEDIGERL